LFQQEIEDHRIVISADDITTDLNHRSPPLCQSLHCHTLHCLSLYYLSLHCHALYRLSYYVCRSKYSKKILSCQQSF
jgi:hypothetical protein